MLDSWLEAVDAAEAILSMQQALDLETRLDDAQRLMLDRPDGVDRRLVRQLAAIDSIMEEIANRSESAFDDAPGSEQLRRRIELTRAQGKDLAIRDEAYLAWSRSAAAADRAERAAVHAQEAAGRTAVSGLSEHFGAYALRERRSAELLRGFSILLMLTVAWFLVHQSASLSTADILRKTAVGQSLREEFGRRIFLTATPGFPAGEQPASGAANGSLDVTELATKLGEAMQAWRK